MLYKEIRSLRLKKGYTQAQLSQLACVSLPTIQTIESGKANPSLIILDRILACLGARIQIQNLDEKMDILNLFNMELSEFKRINFLSALQQLPFTANKNKSSGREFDLMTALASALADHYQQWLLETLNDQSIIKFAQQNRHKIESNRLIKFRRIWLGKLSQVI